MTLLLLSFVVNSGADNFQSIVGDHLEDKIEESISLVIASLGRPFDGEPEDLSWMSSSYEKDIFLYDRTNRSSAYFINTDNGRECLSYIKYIIDNYDTLPRFDNAAWGSNVSF